MLLCCFLSGLGLAHKETQEGDNFGERGGGQKGRTGSVCTLGKISLCLSKC
jgi:hypothetical protein